MFDAYAKHDATALAELVARREVSAAELLDAALAKAEALNPQLNAICTPMTEIAHRRVKQKLSGPFAGVPFLLKDIAHHYAGVPTTSGSLSSKNWTPDAHSELVERFLKAGVVIFGKTTTPEFALKGHTETALFGATRNPWNLDRTPGGSSGGAAAAVAAGIVPIASASDGGGSIRIPASYCGLFGLRPGRGRVSAGQHYDEIWDGASQSHVLTHSIRDSARMLDAIAGPASGDPFVAIAPERPYADEVGREPGRLRIGFSTVSPVGAAVDADCVAAVKQAAKWLAALGHHVEEAAPEVDGDALGRSFLAMYFGQTSAVVAAARALGAHDDEFELDTRALALLGDAMSAGEYVTRRKQWNDYARALGRFHQRYDLHLTPTVAAPAARIGALDGSKLQDLALQAVLRLRAGRALLKSGIVEKMALKNLERVPFTQLSNLTGTPSMSVPLHTSVEGLPVGVQFIAAAGGEGLLIRLASQLEQAHPWSGRRAAL